MSVIELESISKRFGACVALEAATVRIERGERLALIGENGAGKSSLMNVLYGLYRPDSGSLRIDGHEVSFKTPADAIARGIGMVHQHFTLVPTLTVAENVVLGAEPTRFGRLDRARADAEVLKTCDELGFSLEVHATVGSLTVGSQQKVEIVKALHRGASTLILDEPTAVLTPQEAAELFAVTRALSERGVTVVLISHKLTDVLAFATRIVVMRRGSTVAVTTPAQTSPTELAALMTGHAPLEHPRRAVGTKPLLRVEHLSAPGLSDLTFELREGELLGIAGVDGNGQRELVETLTGLRPWSSGSIVVGTTRFHRWTPAEARAHGIAHVPEDRLQRAVIADLSVEENVALGRQRQPPFAIGPRIDVAGRAHRTSMLLEAHDVRPRDLGTRIGALSGGNQQKLVVGRELDGQPQVLIAMQPTRGLDVAAVAAVHDRLRSLRDSGGAVLVVSLDLDEVLALADRLLVMFAGKVTATFVPEAYEVAAVGRAMLGVTDSPGSTAPALRDQRSSGS